ncbi:MAG: copper homeostasis protein CutC, partial [Phaeodactylibacter sp.]|nr:copper homeostasis protein CutC [Phaeodactylibacter sp.]
MKLLEICCDSAASALAAQSAGADRIELCENLAQGGVTPSWGKVQYVKEQLQIPVFVLVRPRKADFLYSDDEFQIMLRDIAQLKAMG